jgi:dCTP deaminase
MLTDRQIRELCVMQGDLAMITPFMENLTQQGVISYGLSSTGYDIRATSEWYEVGTGESVMDVKQPDSFSDHFKRVQPSETFIDIPGHTYMLTHSLEYMRMPRDVSGVCVGKSTYARAGLILNTTPLEPGWEGSITLELYNPLPCPIRVYYQEGICQVLFFRVDNPISSYSDRGGKYQGQLGVQLPLIHKHNVSIK